MILYLLINTNSVQDDTNENTSIEKGSQEKSEEDLYSSCESESSDTDVVQEAAAQTEQIGAPKGATASCPEDKGKEGRTSIEQT